MLLQKYLAKAKDLMKLLDSPEVQHVPREKNIRVDILSKLANMKLEVNHQSLIQVTLKSPSIAKPLPTLAIEGIPNWVTPII